VNNDDAGPAAANDDNDADAAVDIRPSVSTSSHNTMPLTSYCKTLSSAAAEAQHLETSLTQVQQQTDDTIDIITHVDDGQMLYFVYVV